MSLCDSVTTKSELREPAEDQLIARGLLAHALKAVPVSVHVPGDAIPHSHSLYKPDSKIPSYAIAWRS